MMYLPVGVIYRRYGIKPDCTLYCWRRGLVGRRKRPSLPRPEGRVGREPTYEYNLDQLLLALKTIRQFKAKATIPVYLPKAKVNTYSLSDPLPIMVMDL